jgi:hypothetical protein
MPKVMWWVIVNNPGVVALRYVIICPNRNIQGFEMTSLIARIDQALIELPAVRSGTEPYLHRMSELGWAGGEIYWICCGPLW